MLDTFVASEKCPLRPKGDEQVRPLRESAQEMCVSWEAWEKEAALNSGKKFKVNFASGRPCMISGYRVLKP